MATHSELNASEHTRFIKQAALDLGFSFCGVSQATFLEEEAPKLEAWLNKGMHGEMAYMANHFDMRLDPRLLVPGAKSVVSVLFKLSLRSERSTEAANTAHSRAHRRGGGTRVC